MYRAICWPGLGLLAFACGGLLRADETADKPPKEDAAVVESFATVKAEWDALDKKLSQLAEQFREAPADQRDAMRKKYLDLFGQTNPVLTRLRAAAVTEYKATGNENKNVTCTFRSWLGDRAWSTSTSSASFASAAMRISSALPLPRSNAAPACGGNR